jgi:N6-adenosine-specific RNA methylase IME4
MKAIALEDIKILEEYEKFVQPQTPSEFASMKESIKESGQLVPGVVNQQGVLIDGHHRYRACKELGVPFRFEVKHFPSKLDEMMFMWAVNDKRRHYTDAQRIELALQMEPYLREKAKQNQSLAGKLKRVAAVKEAAVTKFGKSSIIVPEKEKVNVQKDSATQAGVSKGTFDKGKHVINSQLFKEDPHFREAFRTEKIRIDNAFQQVKRAEDKDKPKPKPPFGTYDVALIDPPWNYEIPGRGTPENHYPVMTDDEIMSLKIPAAENSALFLWATYPKLDIAIDILRAWGFEYKSHLVWVKDKIGTGYYFRGKHELLLLGIKGSGLGVPAEADRHPSVLEAPRTEHSRKPVEVYEIIEAMYPGRSKIEMFARGEPRAGWTAWGLEAATAEDPTAESIYATAPNTKSLDEDPDLLRFRKFGRPAFQNDKPKRENHWLFQRIDPRLGEKHPGQIPGQIAMNILYYYTEPGDLVVDPFAGGGSTIDACKVMERHCLAYDIKPTRSDIKQWDITKGFHPEVRICDMVFLDPPYWNLMEHLYAKESISSQSLEGFMAVMRKLAEECYKVLKPGGVCSPSHDAIYR